MYTTRNYRNETTNKEKDIKHKRGKKKPLYIECK